MTPDGMKLEEGDQFRMGGRLTTVEKLDNGLSMTQVQTADWTLYVNEVFAALNAGVGGDEAQNSDCICEQIVGARMLEP